MDRRAIILFESRRGGRHSHVKLELRYKAAVMDGEIIAEAKVSQRKQRLFLGEAVVKNGESDNTHRSRDLYSQALKRQASLGYSFL